LQLGFQGSNSRDGSRSGEETRRRDGRGGGRFAFVLRCGRGLAGRRIQVVEERGRGDGCERICEVGGGLQVGHAQVRAFEKLGSGTESLRR
jgi:hypothetical protein